jgi:circadian clock protein KaiC
MTHDGRVSTGVAGLDGVLCGGLPAERAHMLRGGPGTGKTILGLQFLTEGAEPGESALYVHFEETPANVCADAASVGLDASDVEFLELGPGSGTFADDRTYGLFGADEVESADVIESITDAVERVDPDRVFVDPLTPLRHLTPDHYQFKRTVSSFVRYLTERGATLVFATQPSTEQSDEDLEFIAAGTLSLAREEKGRTIEVRKLRGSDFRRGRHTMRITDAGIRVYPVLVPGDHDRGFDAETVSTGVDAFDDLLGGGIERGTVTVVSGPTGVGKTTLGTQLARAAADRGERPALYLFEESIDTLVHRSEALDVPLTDLRADGRLTAEGVEPLRVSPDEFAASVRETVEARGSRFVMIDGVSGYRLSIRGDDDDLVRELHALCRYLRNVGATVVLTDDVRSVTGSFEPTSAPISYLGDNILFLRYVEMGSQLRRVAGVLKKRTGDFERTLREFEIGGDGVALGDPLEGLHGILDGAPEDRRGR